MKEKLMAILEDVRPDLDFEKETKLIDEGILDSFDIISIVEAIDSTFNIEINVEDLEPENFNSVDQIVELIQKLQK